MRHGLTDAPCPVCMPCPLCSLGAAFVQQGHCWLLSSLISCPCKGCRALAAPSTASKSCRCIILASTTQHRERALGVHVCICCNLWPVWMFFHSIIANFFFFFFNKGNIQHRDTEFENGCTILDYLKESVLMLFIHMGVFSKYIVLSREISA